MIRYSVNILKSCINLQLQSVQTVKTFIKTMYLIKKCNIKSLINYNKIEINETVSMKKKIIFSVLFLQPFFIDNSLNS